MYYIMKLLHSFSHRFICWLKNLMILIKNLDQRTFKFIQNEVCQYSFIIKVHKRLRDNEMWLNKVIFLFVFIIL